MIKGFRAIPLLLMALVFAASCKTGGDGTGDVLRIRVTEEPDCLHPVVSQSSLATQIELLIMPPLFEYHPDKLELSPMLVKSLSDPVSLNDSTIAYDYELIEGVAWEDGKPVTASDVMYTIKAALNPLLRNATWRGYFKNIVDVYPDAADPGKFRIAVRKDYMLSREMSGNYCIYPEHIYDPGLQMRTFSIPDLIVRDSASWGSGSWDSLRAYAAKFQNEDYCRKMITGCGPYRLASWDAGNKIVLQKKKDWWGDGMEKDYPLLTAHPSTIEYLVIPEEASAVLALKNKQVDLVTGLSAGQFEELRSNPGLSFATPAVMQYYYLEVNHRDPVMKRKEVRQAIARLLDLDKFIATQLNGLARRIVGPVPPGKAYYHEGLKPVSFDPVAADRLLKEAGWTDSNSDGTLDNQIEGKRTELVIRLSVSGKETGKNLAVLLAEEAARIGVKIELASKETAVFMKDLNEFNFEMATMAARQSPSLWDPFQAWHSSQSRPGGFNKSGYTSPLVDSLITAIRTAPSEELRNQAYRAFQEHLYEEQVQIYLFSPLEKIAYNSNLELTPTIRRPGYTESMIRFKTQ